MAAMSSTSRLRVRQLPGNMIATVATGIADEMAADPGSVPATIRAKARNWSPPHIGGINVIGHDTRAAGWRHGRLPGLRGIVDDFDPVFNRMIAAARSTGSAASAEQEAALRHPQSQDELWRAAIHRWSAWFGRDCCLDLIYRDSQGRLADDPAYTGRSYDADHAPDELLRQVLDVTLIDWIVFLETLRTTWPAMFDAVWRRDAVKVKRLLGNKPRLPVMDFLRMRKEEQDRFCTVVAIFWEAERCFELMHAIGGTRRVTKPNLLAAMRSTSTLGAEVATDSRAARYVATTWCHRGSLSLLFEDGIAIDHDPRHPHSALGPGGDPVVTDEIAGCPTEAAFDSAAFTLNTAPPFALDSRLREVRGEQPAHFFAGRDVRLLAILFLVEVRAWLGTSRGRKTNQPPALFSMTPDSATGRLALLMIARICPHTAASTLREAVDAKVAADHFRQPPFVVTLGDVVANPRAWRTLHNISMPEGSVAGRSEWLGSHMFEGMVDTARKERSRFVRNDPGALGNTICFTPQAWFDPYGETGMLRAAWYNVGADYETAFPCCFDRSIRADELAFCIRVAARQQVGATDMIQDAHARKPDAVRSPNLGKAGAKRVSVAPPLTPPTESQRLLLARIAAAGKGGLMNQPIN